MIFAAARPAADARASFDQATATRAGRLGGDGSSRSEGLVGQGGGTSQAVPDRAGARLYDAAWRPSARQRAATALGTGDVLPIPFLSELAEARPADPDRVTHIEPHLRGV